MSYPLQLCLPIVDALMAFLLLRTLSFDGLLLLISYDMRWDDAVCQEDSYTLCQLLGCGDNLRVLTGLVQNGEIIPRC